MAKDAINPTNQFINQALPKGDGDNVLMVGEFHFQSSHKDYLKERLQVLKYDNDVGSLAFEMPGLAHVFMWAYRDGKLPVPKACTETYLKEMYRRFCPLDSDDGQWTLLLYEKRAKAMDSQCDLAMKAIDHGIEALPFDSRSSVADIKSGVLWPWAQWFHTYFRGHPQQLEDIRKDPATLLPPFITHHVPMTMEMEQALQNGTLSVDVYYHAMEAAFAVCEAVTIVNANPEYRRWLANYEAVIRAGRQVGLDSDTLSANLIAASRPPSKNTIGVVGLSHLTHGKPLAGDALPYGTLARQLRRLPLSTTECMIFNDREARAMAPLLQKDGPLMQEMKAGGLPEYRLPPMVMLDQHRILDIEHLPPDPKSGTFEATLAEARGHYASTPTPEAHVHDAEHIERMHARSLDPAVQGALDKLRTR